jgi:PAS domain S-box-containing protein
MRRRVFVGETSAGDPCHPLPMVAAGTSDLRGFVHGRASSFLDVLFDQSPIGLNLCTMEGLWLESNPAFLAMIGYSREEADGGLTYWQLTPRRYDPDEAVQLQKLRSTRRYGPYEKEFIHKDGHLVPVRLNGFLVERGGVSYIWSFIEDLTGQRALQAELGEERLKAAHAAKLALVGEMAAGIAHELANPLSVLQVCASALRGAASRGEPSAESLDAIEEAARRATKIVQGLTRFSRMDDAEGEVPLDLGGIVEDALLLCRMRPGALGVEVQTDLRARGRVRGRALELSQIVVNLVSNALDAASHASPRWVRLSTSDGPDEGWVTLAVEDSGPRIPAQVARRMFEPFFTTKPTSEGTGLGLGISRRLVEGHGGTLAYDAAAPVTRFVVRLPASA